MPVRKAQYVSEVQRAEIDPVVVQFYNERCKIRQQRWNSLRAVL